MTPWTPQSEQPGCCDLTPISSIEWHAMRAWDSLALNLNHPDYRADYNTRYPWNVVHGEWPKMKYIYDVLGRVFYKTWQTQHIWNKYL